MSNSQLSQRISSLPSTIWEKIAQIDEFKGGWIGATKLHPQTLGRLKRSVLVTSTGASTRIEGALLTDADIEKLLRGISIQQFSDRDKQEVRGYHELLSNVFDSWDSLSFTEGLIKHFHAELLKYVEKDQVHRGEYKQQENKVHMVDTIGQSIGVLFDTTPAWKTSAEMQELIAWTKESLTQNTYHPLLVIASCIVQFLKIHPFQDGNGRLSRILTNLLLLQSGYAYIPYISHEKLIEDNKPNYYMALRASQKTFQTKKETIQPWLEFFLSVVGEQSKRAIMLLSEENIEGLLSPIQQQVWQYMQKTGKATPKELSEQLAINRATVNQVLTKLLQLQKIERVGLGRATRYVLSSENS